MLTTLVATMLLQDRVELAPYPPIAEAALYTGDYLTGRSNALSRVYRGPHADEVTLDNGIVRRTFRFRPDVATISLTNLRTKEQTVVKALPEARLTINGKEYVVGGLADAQGQHPTIDSNSLNQSQPISGGFRLYQVSVATLHEPLRYQRDADDSGSWPPRGMALKFRFSNDALPGLVVSVDHEMYDGVPVMMKRLVITNGAMGAYRIDSVVADDVALAPKQTFETPWQSRTVGNVEMFTDFLFGEGGYGSSTAVQADPQQGSLSSVVMPGVVVGPGRRFESHRTFLVLHDSDDVARHSLTLQKTFRLLAPWASRPVQSYVLNTTDDESVKAQMQAAADMGFSSVVFSLESGINVADASPANVGKFRALVDHAKSLGLRTGGYLMLAGQSIDEETDVVPPGPAYGSSPCLGSQWAFQTMQNTQQFLAQTGMSILEIDGAYGGDPCSSNRHPGHQGEADSVWNQWKEMTSFIGQLRTRGVDVITPGWNVLSGAVAGSLAYRRETIEPKSDPSFASNLSRQFGFGTPVPLTTEWANVTFRDSTAVSQWATLTGYGLSGTFRPSSELHEPQRESLTSLNQRSTQLIELLTAPSIPLSLDESSAAAVVMHVSPLTVDKGLLVVTNPTDAPVTQAIAVPLFGTGITNRAKMSTNGTSFTPIDVRGNVATVTVTVPANGVSYVYLRQA